MTTYAFNLSLDEQEFWAIKEAMKFYLTSEAAELRMKNPHLVEYAADINLRKMLSTGRIYQDVQPKSWNSFRRASNPKVSFSGKDVNAKATLEEVVLENLESNTQLASLAKTPISEVFINAPLVSQLILDCIIGGLENSDEKTQLECVQLLGNNKARNFFIWQTALKLHLLFGKKHLDNEI
jgi:hypothetical protein